jgi:hypothetical protein
MDFVNERNSLPKDLKDLLTEDALSSGLAVVLEALLSSCRLS